MVNCEEMQYLRLSATVVMSGVVFAALSVGAPAQDTQNKEPQAREIHGISPRATPADYQSHAQSGTYSLAAEFTGHTVPTPEALYSTEDYVGVEVGIFGAPGARLNLSYADFSLRINGKKNLVPAQPYTFVFKSLKDPEWEPPVPAGSKSKTSIGSGGKNEDGTTPAPVHMPLQLERTMDQRVQAATLPEAEHPLPAAGLIFFQYRGKADGIHSVDLIYTGPAGKVTLPLHP